MDLKGLIGKFTGGGSVVKKAVDAVNPIAALAGGLTSSASLDSKNQIATGDRTVGGINYAAQSSNLLTVAVVGALAVAGVYIYKKVR